MLEWRRFEAAGQFAFGVVASDVGIRAIELNAATELPGRECESNPLLRQAVEQLRAYFAGALRDFDLTLDMQGTEFQRRLEWRRFEAAGQFAFGVVASDVGIRAIELN